MQLSLIAVFLLLTLVAYINATPTSILAATPRAATSSSTDPSSATSYKMAKLVARALPFNTNPTGTVVLYNYQLWILLVPIVIILIRLIWWGIGFWRTRHTKIKRMEREERSNGDN
jgi:hypothetical protein